MSRQRHSPLSDSARFPLLSDTGRKRLKSLREHPHAPCYNHPCGEQLDKAGLERVLAFDLALETSTRGWSYGTAPFWLHEFTAWCLTEVPFYRRRGKETADFFSLPPISRSDLAREPWEFVPDGQMLDELVVYDTSGTSGEPMLVLSHPTTSASYLPALRWTLAKHGVTLTRGAPVSLALISAHQHTFTYATVSSYLGEAGCLKLSLHPDGWRHPQDRVSFLNDCAPEIFTGDPLAFMALADLPLSFKPKALVSSATTLLPGLKTDLESHFGCPVIDVYSMNESRFIAYRLGEKWEIVPPDLFIEILNEAGHSCPPGVVGEIVLTGGRNPYLPLLRYRTGDYAALEFSGDTPSLINFMGRPPVYYLATDGRIVPSLEINHALRQFPLAGFALHQGANSALTLKVCGKNIPWTELRASLLKLFGSDQVLNLTTFLLDTGNKTMPFTSDINEIRLQSNPLFIA